MAANLELQVEQKRRLFQLLGIRKALTKINVPLKLLDTFIIQTEAEMSEEDIAFIEKKIAQLELSE